MSKRPTDPRNPKRRLAHGAFRHPLAGKAALITGAARRVGACYRPYIARGWCEPRAPLSKLLGGCGGARSGVERRATGLRGTGRQRRSARNRQAASARRGGDPGVWRTRHSRQQCVDVLPDAGRRHHRDRLGRPHGDQPQGALVSVSGSIVAPALHANQGLILNLADIHGMRPLRRHPVYSIAKAGLIMLTRSLARELVGGPSIR